MGGVAAALLAFTAFAAAAPGRLEVEIGRTGWKVSAPAGFQLVENTGELYSWRRLRTRLEGGSRLEDEETILVSRRGVSCSRGMDWERQPCENNGRPLRRPPLAEGQHHDRDTFDDICPAAHHYSREYSVVVTPAVAGPDGAATVVIAAYQRRVRDLDSSRFVPVSGPEPSGLKAYLEVRRTLGPVAPEPVSKREGPSKTVPLLR